MKRRTKKRANQGLTLVEILMVMLLLIVVVVGFLGVFIVSFALGEHSRNVVVALNDASSVMEDMRNIVFASLPALYPDGVAVAGYANLPSETVVVEYTNIGADAVTANVVVSWTERSRNFQETITTVITKNTKQ